MPKKKRNSNPPKKENEILYRPEAPSNTKSKVYFKDKRYYFNVHVRRWKKHIDGDWDNGPLIFKVPLSPEQAVLSCCSADYHGESRIRFAGTHCNFGNGGIVCLTTAGKANCGNVNPGIGFDDSNSLS